eukprot:scaffold2960_cov61-Phaeocystis_antarctica.AAC.5
MGTFCAGGAPRHPRGKRAGARNFPRDESVGGPVRDGVAGGQDRMVGECGWLGEGRSCEHAIAYGTTDSLTVSVCW